jgi:hypothetical protein
MKIAEVFSRIPSDVSAKSAEAAKAAALVLFEAVQRYGALVFPPSLTLPMESYAEQVMASDGSSAVLSPIIRGALKHCLMSECLAEALVHAYEASFVGTGNLAP